MTNTSSKTLPYLAATISCTIFGLSFLFSKMALDASSPIALVAFRFLIAFIIMSVLIKFKMFKVNYKNKEIKDLILLSIAEPVFYFIFETYGIKATSSSIAGLMLSLIPIAVTILGAFFLNEIPSIRKIRFILLSVSGVALIGIMSNSSGGGNSLLGMALLLGAVTSAGFFSIISRKASKHFTPIEITYFMMFVAAVFFNLMWLGNLVIHKKITSYFEPLRSLTFDISIIYLGILSSIVAYSLINYTLSKIQASKSSVFSNLSTIVSIAAGVIFLRESFHIYELVGSVLILIGLWGANKYN
ncbi:DMT family transporter [Clostridium akagii]|uniref:DMT family transporter n=1 Tax=Clostridium akagii TaxID=91623 RepID=UPI00047C665E|nr:DMT family transporter [Clostridium akagii]